MLMTRNLEERIVALKGFLEMEITKISDTAARDQMIVKRGGLVTAAEYLPTNRTALAGRPTTARLGLEYVIGIDSIEVNIRAIYSNSEANSKEADIMPAAFHKFLKRLIGEQAIVVYKAVRKNGIRQTPILQMLTPSYESVFKEVGAYVKARGTECPRHVSYEDYLSRI